MRVGFPLVLERGAVAVWVDCRPVNATDGLSPQIEWGDCRLPRDRPFFSATNCENEKLNSLVSELLNYGKNLAFSGDDLPLYDTCDNKPYVLIKGDSYGLALHLARTHKLINIAGEDGDRVLLSGSVRGESTERLGSSISACRPHSDLYYKWFCAYSHRLPLLLLQDDFDALREELQKLWDANHFTGYSEKAVLMAGRGDFSSWENFKNDFKEWEQTNGCGRAYPLPIAGKYWGKDSTRWHDGLAEFLKLEPVRYAEVELKMPPDNIQAGTEEELPADMPEENIIKPVGNEIGNIYRAALPNESEYLRDFLSRNKKHCALPIYPDGMLEKALAQTNKERLFYNRAGDSFVYNHIIISGPTAGGKTFLAESLLLNCALEEGLPAMLIAPTRALVNEIYHRLLKGLKSEGETYELSERSIIRSTGEYSQDDDLLRAGKFKIALVVSEKANIFMQPEYRLTERLGLLVIDELHMLAQPQRGGVLDLLLAKARMRRNDTDLPGHKLRIAVISTEPDIKKAGLEKALSAYNYVSYAADIEPVALLVENRPFSVRHKIVLWAQTSIGIEQRSVDLISFNGQADRLRAKDDAVLQGKREAILREQGKLLATVQKNGPAHWAPPEEVMSVIRNLSKHHKKVIVVCGSKDLCLKLAQREKNLRLSAIQKHERVVEVKKIDLPSGGLLSKKTSDLLQKLAGCGLYLHHADIPRVTRECVEDIFRSDNCIPFPEIVFTTETLSYGVNLLADCVILLGLHFPRTDICAPESNIEYKALTATEYHNILGRAGRSPDVAAEAYTLFNVEKFDAESITTLLKYYMAQDPLMPVTFSRRDIRKAQTQKIESLDSITYETFRSVMDALRTASGKSGSSVTLQDLKNIVENTVFWEISSPAQRTNTEILMERILEVAANYQGMRLIEIFEASSGTSKKYRILPQAEALIDTGTRWTSVAPMRGWLEIFYSLSKDSSAPLPVVLMLPAFICTPDFWRIGKEFCVEASQDKLPTDIVAKTDNIWQIVRTELADASMDLDKLDTLRSRLNDFITGNNCSALPIKEGGHRVMTFYKLFAVLLQWVRGVSLDDINLLSVKETSVPEHQINDFSIRYAERAAWLVVMCYRFFGKHTDLISKEHLRELPQLAQRLRVGLPQKGLPFYLDNDQVTHKLDRDEIRSLLDVGLTASSIVTSKNPQAFVLASIGQNNEKLGKKAKHIAGITFNFYKSQLRKLRAALEDNSKEPWSTILTLYNGMIGEKSTTKGATISDENVIEFNRCLRALLNARISDGTPQGNVAIPAGKGTVLNCTAAKLNLCLHCLAPDDELDGTEHATPDIVVYVPWRRGEAARNEHLVELTSFAALTLAALVGRNCIQPSELLKLKVYKGKILSIADIVTLFQETSTDVDAFAERLLEVVELSE